MAKSDPLSMTFGPLIDRGIPVLLNRPNQLDRRRENWRPPLFRPIRSRRDRLYSSARRFLDLQAGSIWRDLSLLLPQFHGLILDVGCGAQPYRSLVHPDATYLGLDRHDADVHFGYSMPEMTYFRGDHWPIGDASADLVLSTETLEHVPDPSVFLDEAFRCLRPGGHILLTVPFAARWHFIPHDYWRFTPSGLGRLLRKSGFSDVTVYARGNAITVACYKGLALFVRLLMPQIQNPWKRIPAQAIGVLMFPLAILIALAGNVSLSLDGGDDCLGYTAVAVRPTH
jgi:SAM-dependent methyltransferase